MPGHHLHMPPTYDLAANDASGPMQQSCLRSDHPGMASAHDTGYGCCMLLCACRFHLVSYSMRMRAAAACMAGAFLVVALSSHMGGQVGRTPC